MTIPENDPRIMFDRVVDTHNEIVDDMKQIEGSMRTASGEAKMVKYDQIGDKVAHEISLIRQTIDLMKPTDPEFKETLEELNDIYSELGEGLKKNVTVIKEQPGLKKKYEDLQSIFSTLGNRIEQLNEHSADYQNTIERGLQNIRKAREEKKNIGGTE